MQQQFPIENIDIFIPPKRKRGRPAGRKKVKITGKVGRPRKDAKVLPINTTFVFHLNRSCDSQILINRGGSRSSKSYSIAQLLIEYFFTIPKIKILMLRKTQPALRTSIKPLVYEILNLYNLRSKITEVKQDMNLWSPVKGLIHFGGLDDPEKIKSSDWSIIWCEESNEFTYEDFINLKLRLSTPTYRDFRNKMILSFNPVDEFCFIKTKIIDNKSEDFTEIVSNYKLNPFLSADYVKTIESLEFQDANYFRIFAQGEWGKLENVIYNNWEIVSYLLEGEKIFGLDFGFVNPTAFVQLNVDGLEVGIQQKIYQSGLTNQDLIRELHSIMTKEEKEQCPIYADSAEPQRIEELNREGFWVIPANKSVKDGIDYVKRCRLRITNDSDNIIKEIRGYSRKTDKNGRVLEEPVKFNDHGLDAIRYGLHTHALRNIRRSNIVKIAPSLGEVESFADKETIKYSMRKSWLSDRS